MPSLIPRNAGERPSRRHCELCRRCGIGGSGGACPSNHDVDPRGGGQGNYLRVSARHCLKFGLTAQPLTACPNTSSVTLQGWTPTRPWRSWRDGSLCGLRLRLLEWIQAPSHVLTAMGLRYDDAKATLRISLSADTRWEEIDLAGVRDCMTLASSMILRRA